MKNSISYDYVSDCIHAFHMASFNYHSESEKILLYYAFDAIEYYVKTDRASIPWIYALQRANPYKMLSFMAKKDDSSTMGMIKAATEYLRKYCRLETC